ncbi:MAG TPA: septal ring lytic transglycosylase RlpA family protein [Xanthobacteraceae bacterium]|jgi:rare lipoprotein A
MRSALPFLVLLIVHTGSAGPACSQSLRGKATYYWHSQKTANGERFHPEGMTAAHRTLPFGTQVRVTHARTKRSVVVRINDRGPFTRGITIDLARGAARQIGMLGEGISPVEMQILR